MANEEKILEMLAEMQADMKDVKKRLITAEKRLDELAGKQEEVCTSFNALLDWIECRTTTIKSLTDELIRPLRK